MKIRKRFILISIIVFFISNSSLAQNDTSKVESIEFSYTPQFYGGQVEVCLLPLGLEFGGLIDIDLFSNKKTQIHFIGLRISGEYYGYGSPGGRTSSDGPFFDFCVYGRPSLRFNNFSINAYGGLAYHTGERESGGILPRGGFEAKYNIISNYVGIMLKGSTSFKSNSGFIGLGIALGYFN